MWIPKDADELEQAIESKSVDETHNLEFKKQLPSSSSGNPKVAREVAGLAVDGGILIYGVDQDEADRPTVLVPFELAGAEERVRQIVLSCVEEVPDIDVVPLWKDDKTGYLMVVVPASPRAPHQVTVKGDKRYYGRTGSLTVPLDERAVARLYERRERWGEEGQGFLEGVISAFPTEPDPVGWPALFVGVRPLGNPAVEDFQISGWTSTLVAEAREAVNDHLAAFTHNSPLPRTDGVRCDMSRPRYQKFFDVTLRCEVRLMTMRPGDNVEGRGYRLFPNVIQQNIQFAAFVVGRLFEKVGFYGNAQVAFALVDAAGTAAFTVEEFNRGPSLHTNDHRESHIVSSRRLRTESDEVVEEVTRNLFRALAVNKAEGEFSG